ncbi:MAG TPA: membrane-binding protein [Flavobacterium sp.]|jgi:antitoxin component YwqK of YwqJK toxin-antitoxin module
MKKYMIMGMLLASGVIFAQETAPKLEAQGKYVKVTYFHENGNIQQEGFFLDGKPEGKWAAYDAEGNKKSIGEYSNGMKSGKWLFWNGANLSEVDYSESRIATVKTWTQSTVADRN